MSLQTRLSALITAIGADIKTLSTNKMDRSATYSADPGTPRFVTNINATLATTFANLGVFYVNSVLVAWWNEWGALRGTSPYTWGDALVRAIRSNGDGLTGAGNCVELVDRTTAGGGASKWGIGWDGVQYIGGTSSKLQGNATVHCVLVAKGATAPTGLPDGTLIFEKSS